jgi:hypothetical protein
LPNGNRQEWNLQWQKQWKMRELFLAMLKRKLPFSEQDVIAVLDWSANRSENHSYYRGIPQMIKVVGDYVKGNDISDNLQKAVGRLIHVIEAENMSVEARRWVLRLKDLRGDSEIGLPLNCVPWIQRPKQPGQRFYSLVCARPGLHPAVNG